MSKIELKPPTWMKLMYEKPWFRSLMRIVKTGFFQYVGYIVQESIQIVVPQLPEGASIVLGALLQGVDKYLRDKGIY